MNPNEYTPIELSDEHRNNLEILAKDLEALDPHLFYMGSWAAKVGCGTVACAMGHATYLFPPIDDEIDQNRFSHYTKEKDYTIINYERFGTRVFGLSKYDETEAAWRWIFDWRWANTDNTPTGAAKRIRILLKHGLLRGWYTPMFNDITLEY